MSMSTHVVGIVQPDETWTRMKAVYDACEKAEVDPPDEVINFFNGEEPDSRGVVIALQTTEWKNEMSLGVELDLSTLPKSVRVIRFYNSW